MKTFVVYEQALNTTFTKSVIWGEWCKGSPYKYFLNMWSKPLYGFRIKQLK